MELYGWNDRTLSPAKLSLRGVCVCNGVSIIRGRVYKFISFRHKTFLIYLVVQETLLKSVGKDSIPSNIGV